ncbi:hypothetical protein METHP15_850012 [Pseudomonas sp. P15-2025]
MVVFEHTELGKREFIQLLALVNVVVPRHAVLIALQGELPL